MLPGPEFPDMAVIPLTGEVCRAPARQAPTVLAGARLLLVPHALLHIIL